MTKKGLLQGREQIASLFVQRRQIATDATKDLGSGLGAKAARDLLLHFDHANVALGQRVGPSRQLHRLHL